VVVAEVLGFSYPYLTAAIIVMLSALVNLGVTFALPLDRRVGNTEAIFQLGFDTIQLALLLWLTGGMTNPFLLLFVAPVVTSATTLSKRVLFSIGGLAVVSSLFLMFNHLPLPWSPQILKQLGARGDTGEPMHDTMRLQAMLEEASEPYFGLGSQIEIKTYGEGPEPDLRRQAEILYGLKNAKTLIERTGGRVSFDNHPRSGGAFITLNWPLEKIAV